MKKSNRRRYNGLYEVHDKVLKVRYTGTLQDIAYYMHCPLSTITMALKRGNMIYRRYEVKFKG